MAASESSEEGAGAEVGGEAEARRRARGEEAVCWRRCINSGSCSAADLVDASAVERPAAGAVTRMTACEEAVEQSAEKS